MMCKCWEEDPDDRPSFSEISTFISKLLQGQNKPAPGSDEEAGYSYSRKATQHIPDDYLDNPSEYADKIVTDDSYITTVPSVTPAAPAAAAANDTPMPDI